MATAPQDFRFGNFVASIVWLVFWILVIVSLVGLPLIFILLILCSFTTSQRRGTYPISLLFNDGRSHQNDTYIKIFDPY